MNLVIVESPTKAKTISTILDRSYNVQSCFGHVRDLPKSQLGVDVTHSFKPTYVIPTKSRKVVNALKKAAQKADLIFLATDEDREGEAISWHLSEILDAPADRLKRITFHEITAPAIKTALEHPRHLDLKLVDAQQARRILDRLVGYKLSPLLWRKVRRGLSAGRVQSVAVRLIVEREREREAFQSEEYWSVEAVFNRDGNSFNAKLIENHGQKIEKMTLKTESEAKTITDHARAAAAYRVQDVERKMVKKNPPTPFTTSTLQQEANTRLNLSAKQTMGLAQQLYETGRITYMRTDSLNLSELFLSSAQEAIGQLFGTNYQLAEPRRFKTKSKGAQEAHEAIRPTDPKIMPADLKNTLEPAAWRLYQLIWSRTLASQMPEAELEKVAVDIAGNNLIFRANGSAIVFDGFMRVYRAVKEVLLPQLQKGDAVTLVSVEPNQHFTEPPARYSDAALVKTMEEHGIGRPSTYAPTIATIIARGYVERDEGKRLFPTEVAKVVTDLLREHFPQIIDYEFTAKMEEELDEIAEGQRTWVPIVQNFYEPFEQTLTVKEQEIVRTKKPDRPTDQVCEICGQPMVLKDGRFGEFLACSGYPECKNTKPIQKSTGVKCPQCREGEITEKRSKRGRLFWSCNRYPQCAFALWNKPTGQTCEKCGSLMIFGGKETTKCSNKTCA